MPEKTFVRLQQSEGIVAGIASRLLAAYVAAGQVTPTTEDAMIDRSLSLAVRLARKVDLLIESDDETGQR